MKRYHAHSLCWGVKAASKTLMDWQKTRANFFYRSRHDTFFVADLRWRVTSKTKEVSTPPTHTKLRQKKSKKKQKRKFDF